MEQTPDSNLLIANGNEYSGMYVALRSFTDKNVVVSGSDPKDVYDRAILNGIADPVVFFVPQSDMVHIY